MNGTHLVKSKCARHSLLSAALSCRTAIRQRQHATLRWFTVHHNLGKAKSKLQKSSHSKVQPPYVFNQTASTTNSEPACLRSVEALAKWKEEVASKPELTPEERHVIRSILSQALLHNKPDIQRYAALYTLKTALLFPPAGVNTALAQHALAIVEHLSGEEDPEAMILCGRYHEQTAFGDTYGYTLVKASNLYEDAVKLLDKNRWTKAPRAQLIVEPGDALFAFGSLNFNSTTGDVSEQASRALLRAVSEYNHFEACKFLEGNLDPGTAEHYDCLLRLAVTGHHASAKSLGDLHSPLGARTFSTFDLELQKDALGGESWVELWKVWSSPGTGINYLAQKLSFIVFNKYSFQRLINADAVMPPMANASRIKVFWRKITTAAWYNRAMNGAKDSIDGKTWADQAAKDTKELSQRIIAHADLDRKNALYDWRPDGLKVSHFKALDWYKLAAIGGHFPAMVEGLELAMRLRLMWEVYWFYWHISMLSKEAKAAYPSENLMLHSKDRTAMEWIKFLEHTTMKKFDMNRLTVYGTV